MATDETKDSAADLESQKIAQFNLRYDLRQKNLQAEGNRPGPAVFKNLDGSIKKNTSFIKKLKTSICQDQLQSLIKELLSLKLEKYTSEVAGSIAEAKLKNSADVWAGVEICSLMHQRFAEFTPVLVSTLVKQLAPPGPPANGVTAEQKEKDDVARIAKQKNSLRLLGELYLVGIAVDPPNAKEGLINQILKDLIASDKELVNYPIVLVFVKFLYDYFKMTRTDGDGTELSLVTPQVKESIVKLMENYYNAVSNKLQNEHKRVRMMEKSNHEHLMTHGKLQEGKQERLEKASKVYEKILSCAQTMSETLNLPMVELPEEEGVTRISSIGISDGNKDREEKDMNSGPWEDEETRSFYEDLFDLKSWVPSILIDKEKNSEKESTDPSDEPTSPIVPEEPATPTDKETAPTEAEGESTKKKPAGNSALDALLSRLPMALNRDAIDQIAKEFAYLNSKGARKKLISTLLAVPRMRVDLLSHYSRLIATLNLIQPDIGTTIVDELEKEFHARQRKKDQVFIEEKLKNIRFIGELTKFGVTPMPKVFHCLHVLLEDFSHHNIDLTCALLETCGRYLYRRPESNVRTTNMLDVMMRKRGVQHLDPRQNLMIENAYYQCNPPDRSANVTKERTPIELYVRKLIYFDLSKKNVEKCLKQLRKLNWEDASIRALMTKIFFKIWKVKFSNLHLMAFMVSELSRYYSDFGLSVVDNALEEIRIGLEMNLFKHNQKRIAVVKFLGELYNYRMVDSNIIFENLYLILRFGHENGVPIPGTTNSFDACYDFFRVRLCCTLLDTCGQYFDRGASGKKLDQFLVYLQLYMHTKIPPPMDIEFMLSETCEQIRPSMPVYYTFEAAAEELNKIVMKQQGNAGVDQRQSQSGGVGNEPSSPVDDVEDEDYEDEADRHQIIQDESESGSDDDEDDDNDDGSEAGVVEEEEAVVVHVQGPEIDEEAEMEFEREYSKLMQESLESRKYEKKPTAFDVAIPIRSRQNNEEENVREGTVAFSLLTKRGTKQQIKTMSLPSDSALVISTKSKQEAEQEEKLQLKKLVLGYEERERQEHEQPQVRVVAGRGRGRGVHNKRVLWSNAPSYAERRS
ncbi:hypothetical protein HK098_006494 [Nowakowskiella sp. JEL0407]|nr:hypothetical protein HK098_006494 [Nowakowskiella sp. JEL0407]